MDARTEYDRPIEASELADHVAAALDSGHRDLIASRCLLIGIAYAGLAMFNGFTMPDDIVMPATLLALGTAAVFAALAWFHNTCTYPLTYVNSFAIAELAILHVDSLIFIALTQDVMNSMGLYFMVVSTGIFLGSVAWIAGSVLGLIGSWMLLMAWIGLPIDLLAHGLALLTAVLFCPFFYLLRLRAQRRLSATQIRETRYRKELEAAHAHIDTLTGLLPICAGCKKIRHEDGSWSQVEDYITGHSDIEFTHSFCDACIVDLYPEHANT